MRSHWGVVAGILISAAIGTTVTPARAQRVVVVGEGGGEDWTRFRGGIALTGGGVFLNGYSVGVVGVDGRLGVQLNRLLGIYLQPHLVFGGGDSTVLGNKQSGFDGVVGMTGVVDFTFDRLFVGAGAGFAYTGVNNFYASPEGHLRIGFYPVVQHGFRGRRRGLMIGADLHFIYWTLPGNGEALMEPTISIGYEAF